MSEYIFTQKDRFFFVVPKPSGHLALQLNTLCSYERKGAEYMPNPEWATVKLYSIKQGRFPFGLLNKIRGFFDTIKVSYVVNRDFLNLNGFKPDVEHLRLYQNKAMAAVFNSYGGILSMPTGAGKTRIALTLVRSFTPRLKTLVVVPTLILRDQWERQLLENDNVIVRTYQSLKSKCFIQCFDIIVFDECHIVAAKTIQRIGLNLRSDSLVVGLSATPFMRDDDNMKVESVLGPIVYEISLRELIDDGFLVDADVFMHDLSPLVDKFSDYHATYQKYIVDNSERNAKIITLACDAAGYGDKILILVDRIDHGESLFKMLSALDTVFLHGTSKLEERADIDHDIIIATSIFDLGVDIPSLNVLILAGGGKSAIKVIQRMGRVLRLFEGKGKAVIHDFIDRSKWLMEHSAQRMLVFQENFKVTEVPK